MFRSVSGPGIPVSDYVTCFTQCANAVRDQHPDAQVLVGAVGCWNTRTGATGPYEYAFDNDWNELIGQTSRPRTAGTDYLSCR
ncbi:MAG: hypothetical protein QGG40_04800 [Myxococcota bacterium]|nr:hypothetical protein [Myxococcota bacterium]